MQQDKQLRSHYIFLFMQILTKHITYAIKSKSHQKRCDIFFGTPNGNRTHVAGMRIRCPGPLDDGADF